MNGSSGQAEMKNNGDGHSHHQPYMQQTSKADLLTLEIVTQPNSKTFRQPNRGKKIKIMFVISALVVAFLVVAGAITAAVLLTRGEGDRGDRDRPGGDGVCRTPGCVSLSNLLMSNLNGTVDPCDDFYNFACGGWLNQASLPAGFALISQPTIYGRNSTKQLRSVLESNTSFEIEAVKKVKSFYQLCMDTDAINEVGVEPLLALIERTGGWNLIDGARSGEWSINSAHFIENKLYRSRAFFAVNVDIDEKNSSEYVIKITQGKILIPYGPSDTFKQYFTEVMSLVNSSVPVETYQDVADSIIALDAELKAISVTPNMVNVDTTYNKIELGDLPSLWPDYDWVSSLKYLFSLHNISIDENEMVIVETPDYFRNLSVIFHNTSAETLENYAKWHLVSFFIEYLSYPFVDAFYKYQYQPVRFDTCFTLLRRALPIAVARQYIEEFYPVESKNKAVYIVNKIIEAFRKRLEDNEWLDSFSKELSLEKVNNIGKKIAFPDQLFNDTYLNALSSDIVIYDNFMQTVAETRRALISRDLRRLHQAVTSELWTYSPISSNAFYSNSRNEITVSAVFILPPNFRDDWPDFYNFGALGTIIGHELTHGFDNNGQLYNQNGNYGQWWSPTAVKQFRQEQKCFLEQYSNYTFFDHQIPPHTLAENIADNGGLLTSYQAYKSLVLDEQQLFLPGLSYTPDQLFFIAQAQVLCTQYEPAAAEYILRHPHSPAPYRVIGPMSNSKEFSKAFMCPLGAPMNPQRKCVLW